MKDQNSKKVEVSFIKNTFQSGSVLNHWWLTENIKHR